MTTILVQALAGLMLLLFAAMALLPLLFPDRPATRSLDTAAEDRVLHVSPVPMIERIRPVPSRRPFGREIPGDASRGRDAA